MLVAALFTTYSGRCLYCQFVSNFRRYDTFSGLGVTRCSDIISLAGLASQKLVCLHFLMRVQNHIHHRSFWKRERKKCKNDVADLPIFLMCNENKKKCFSSFGTITHPCIFFFCFHHSSLWQTPYNYRISHQTWWRWFLKKRRKIIKMTFAHSPDVQK